MSRSKLVPAVALALGTLAMLPTLGSAQAPALGFISGAVAHADFGARRPVPFAAGERLDYEVKFGSLSVGKARMEVVGTADVRDREAWHVRFTVKGGVPLYRMDDRMESWMDTRTLHSLRFHQDLNEGRRERTRRYEIHPDRQLYFEGADTVGKPSVGNPLDDGAFIYFVRTLPLEVGKTYTFDNYFRPDRNPVRITVLRRETVKVPAGTFETVVVRPSIRTKGIFSESGQAELWLTDDDRRMLVQMKSKLSFGSLNLYLKSAVPGDGPATASR